MPGASTIASPWTEFGKRRRGVRLPAKRILGLFAVLAITATIGLSARWSPVEANGPPSGQEATFPYVYGVDGRMGSIAQINMMSCGYWNCHVFVPQSFTYTS